MCCMRMQGTKRFATRLYQPVGVIGEFRVTYRLWTGCIVPTPTTMRRGAYTYTSVSPCQSNTKPGVAGALMYFPE